MISTKGRYAVRFMIDLAEQQDGLPVPLEDVALRQQISKKYLETVVNFLVKAKLVKVASGKGGGYRLLRRPAEYTVGEILKKARWQQLHVWTKMLISAREKRFAKPCQCGKNMIQWFMIFLTTLPSKIL